jgi:hypothetical protein
VHLARRNHPATLWTRFSPPSRCSSLREKAAELSTSDGVSEPATRCLAPSTLDVEGSAALSVADELTAGSSRQPGLMEGGLAYAAVVAGRAVPCQESGPLKTTANGSGTPNPLSYLRQTLGARLFETCPGLLNGTPAGTTPDTPMQTTTAVPAGQRHNKNLIYVSGVTDTRGFLAWLRESCPSGLSAQMKGEIYAGVKDDRWLPSHGTCAAVP